MENVFDSPLPPRLAGPRKNAARNRPDRAETAAKNERESDTIRS